MNDKPQSYRQGLPGAVLEHFSPAFVSGLAKVIRAPESNAGLLPALMARSRFVRGAAARHCSNRFLAPRTQLHV